MSKSNKEFQVTSVSYVHDPQAAEKWFEIYIEILKKAILENAEKSKD